MDGLASLAAAADLLGEYDTSKQVHSPSKQKVYIIFPMETVAVSPPFNM